MPNNITLVGHCLGLHVTLCFHAAYFPLSSISVYGLPINIKQQLDDGNKFDDNNKYQAHAHAIFFAWVVSDCADGQVARLCGRGTRMGRMFDGMVGTVDLFANLFMVDAVMEDHNGHSSGRWLTIRAGCSLC